jgi:uncharacterized SAM-dependent methyltransferase
LHRAYSPSRNDPDCARIYDEGFEAAASVIKTGRVHLIGLGCGGGQKDTRLLKRLRKDGRELFYSPVDVSPAMVLTARKEALKVVPADKCFPLVCDLAQTTDLEDALADPTRKRARRIVTFFGMLPNFEHETILPRLASFIGAGDILLLSANLAPGSDYAAGVRKVLPLYDNPLTRDWLITFLLDLGIRRGDGVLRFSIEENTGRPRLKRIVAHFSFGRRAAVEIDSEKFEFNQGESIRLFFSYRHTTDLLGTILARYGLEIAHKWITNSEEEGVFLIRVQA